VTFSFDQLPASGVIWLAVTDQPNSCRRRKLFFLAALQPSAHNNAYRV
jgi:hypothetical protein